MKLYGWLAYYAGFAPCPPPPTLTRQKAICTKPNNSTDNIKVPPVGSKIHGATVTASPSKIKVT
jgi:hypothetical protein